MLLNPVCLLLSSAWMIGFSESYIFSIDCDNVGLGWGSLKVEDSWVCHADGSAACSQKKTDCSDCGDTAGYESGGTSNYDKYGRFDTAVGPGWDCRSQCKGRPGTSGSKENTRTDCCSIHRPSDCN
eukprot:GFUD01030476.1.p1 GENE.GFUD01030476.1~~GFUD01030476.1.p1  ORF type:complete len:126 (+),score=13.98 GFUD01030476.1:221-598(+)